MLNSNCPQKTNHRLRDGIPVEYFDLYDRDRRLTGIRARRGDPVPPDCYRLAIHVCLFNHEGDLLIQKRQPFKRKWSGLWDLSVAGSAMCGENSQEAAERETLEELGLEIDLIDHRPALTVHWEKGFDDIFILTMDIDAESLKLQEEEVEAVRWSSSKEILTMIDEGIFIPYEKSFVELLFRLRLHRDIHSRSDTSSLV